MVNFLDWISSIGGVFPIFLVLMKVIYGDLAEYLQNFSMIFHLQEIQRKIEESENKRKKVAN